MEYQDTPLSEEEVDKKVNALIDTAAIAPTPNLINPTPFGPNVEDCIIQSNECGPDKTEFFTAQTDLADIMFDLGHQAYSCLCNTPEGLPKRGFYVWDSEPPLNDLCCDQLVVWLSDYKPYSERTGFQNASFSARGGSNCEDILFAPEITLSLMRPCRPIFNSEGTDLADTKKKNHHGYNTMTDIRTLTCCVKDSLQSQVEEDLIGGINWSMMGEFSLGRVRTFGSATCTRIDFSVTLALPDCCP